MERCDRVWRVLVWLVAAAAWAGVGSVPARAASALAEAPATCSWPTAVALRDAYGRVFCSGTLVHAQLVLIAAHCLDHQVTEDVVFGEDARQPRRVVAVDSCRAHPDYDGSSEPLGYDVGYCRLGESVDDVPIIPPAVGCEAAQLFEGDRVASVGFGATSARLGDDGAWQAVRGIGLKRVATLEVESDDGREFTTLGRGQGPCPGDSGGPSFARMHDGSWRVVGLSSRLHPDSPLDEASDCGYGAVHTRLDAVVPWIEDDAGLDITPCHDGDGLWAPTHACGELPAEPGDGLRFRNGWVQGCSGGPTTDALSTCGEPWTTRTHYPQAERVDDEPESRKRTDGDAASGSSSGGEAFVDDVAFDKTEGESIATPTLSGPPEAGCRLSGGRPSSMSAIWLLGLGWLIVRCFGGAARGWRSQYPRRP